MYGDVLVRFPRQRTWPILPGVRSFWNCGTSSSSKHYCALCSHDGGIPLLEYPAPDDELEGHGGLESVEGLTGARSGMKRSPRHRTNLRAIAWILSRLPRAFHGLITEYAWRWMVRDVGSLRKCLKIVIYELYMCSYR